MVLENIPGWLKTLGYALALSTSFELIYYLRNLQTNKNEKPEYSDAEVVFFPDKTLPCDAHFSYGCANKSCWLSHEETSSMKVMQFLEQTRRTLDLCVYCIASQTLVDSVLNQHNQGVIVRVITDQGQAAEHQTMVEKLRAAGIEVRTNDSTFFMHHKFAISDSARLMTGSFNWSRNAMLGNDENVMFVKQERITQKYFLVFENLWEKYSPK